MSQVNNELETAIKQLDRKTFKGLPELVKAGMRAGKLGCGGEFMFAFEGASTTALSFAGAKTCGQEIPHQILLFGIAVNVRLCAKCCANLLELAKSAV